MSLPLHDEVEALVRIRPAFEWFAHDFVPVPGYGLVCPVLSSRARACRRNHQVPRAALPDVALPSSGKRASFPARTLLLGHRSYRPIRQTRWALLSFGYSPRSRNLCRLLPAPATPGFFPTLFLRIRPVMPEPVPRRVPLSASAWFFPNVFGLPKKEIWSASRFFPRTRFSAGLLSRLQLFLYVQAPQLACLPDRSYRCE